MPPVSTIIRHRPHGVGEPGAGDPRVGEPGVGLRSWGRTDAKGRLFATFYNAGLEQTEARCGLEQSIEWATCEADYMQGGSERVVQREWRGGCRGG